MNILSKTASATLAAVASVALLAACGSGSSASSPQPSHPSSAAGNSANLLPTPSAKASGTPLKIFFINQEGASAAASSPEAYQAATAAVDYVNRNLGGLNGRPLQLIHCADLGTPDSSVTCANKAVDAKPDIIVKGVDTGIDTAVPIITKSGIPYVTLQAGVSETAAPNTFIPASGFIGATTGMLSYAKEQGAKTIGVIYSNVTALSGAVQGPLETAARADGITLVPVPVALTTQDLTSAYSTVLAKKVDAIFLMASVGHCAAALKARQSLADSTPLYTAYVCDTSDVLGSVPASATNGLVIGSLDTSSVSDDPDTQIYDGAMKAYASSSATGGFAPGSFEAIMDIYRALHGVPDPASLNAQSIGAALKAAKNVPLFMGGGKTFTCDGSVDPKQPAVCTGWVFLLKYANGEHTLLKQVNTAP